MIVGASEGIGAAYARLLAERGLDLVLVALPDDPFDDVVTAVEVAGGSSETVTGDIGDGDTVERLVEACATREVGLLVVNAALSSRGAVIQTDEDLLVRQIEVNCAAAVRLVRRFLPPMVERGRGGIVLTSSMSSVVASPWLATYAATKAFLARFGESLAEELRGSGVDVAVLMPGAVDTPGFRSSQPAGGPRPIAPDLAARAALDSLGRRTLVVPGGLAASAQRIVMERVLPRKVANRLMAGVLRRMYR